MRRDLLRKSLETRDAKKKKDSEHGSDDRKPTAQASAAEKQLNEVYKKLANNSDIPEKAVKQFKGLTRQAKQDSTQKYEGKSSGKGGKRRNGKRNRRRKTSVSCGEDEEKPSKKEKA